MDSLPLPLCDHSLSLSLVGLSHHSSVLLDDPALLLKLEVRELVEQRPVEDGEIVHSRELLLEGLRHLQQLRGHLDYLLRADVEQLNRKVVLKGE